VSQRESGYERKEHDQYMTPAWVTHALVPHLPKPACIWEPACGTGLMAKALEESGYPVFASDITSGHDFLRDQYAAGGPDGIVTNPPYALACEFIEKALDLTKPDDGFVAMLLRTDYDHAKTRQHLFAGCPAFAKKLVLSRRIKWFDGPGAAPSFNHAWFIWNWRHRGEPTLAYDVVTHS
jgi:hypothetical protein